MFWFQVRGDKVDKFTDIASQPKEEYIFKIENYDGITGILENVQNKIIEIEGDDELFYPHSQMMLLQISIVSAWQAVSVVM